MTTIKIDISKQVAAIDAHLAKNKVAASKAAIGQADICKYWLLASPIIMLLGQILGSKVNAYIVAFAAGITEYCASPVKAGAAGSKSVVKLCAVWTKAQPFVALAIQLFAFNTGWGAALKGLTKAVNSICASPENA